MKIIHISDLHFPVKLPLLELRGKMIAGYLNYRLRRFKKHPASLIDAMIRFIQKQEYDVLVISGDLTNVSHEEEFARARDILAPVLDERCFIIPGNHDRYHKQAMNPDLFEKYFGEFTGENVLLSGYLRTKKIGSARFIGWDSSEPRTLFDAYGEISAEILDETMNLVKKSEFHDYFLVCHHPLWNPECCQESNHHMLHEREMIVERLSENPPVMVMHGHSHLNWIKKRSEEIPFTIVNSAASTRLSDGCGFHVIETAKNSEIVKRYTYQPGLNEFKESDLIEYE